MEKVKQESRVVVPFTGYLHPQLPPEVEPPKQTTPLLTIAVLLFVICPDCGSYKVRFDLNFGFFKCESCGGVWAREEDDPDYDELVDEINNKYAYYGSGPA